MVEPQITKIISTRISYMEHYSDCLVDYSDYNIIPIGDHCAISLVLKDLNLRKQSYPFDWVTRNDQIHDTNIMYNIQIIRELTSSDNVDYIVQKYIGNAFDNDNNKLNSANHIIFPHDTENVADIFEKYKRRFVRLKLDLHKKNIFILLTRHYYIEMDVFQKIVEELLSYNHDSIVLFISGTNHAYFENMKCSHVIFKYIEYDISKHYEYDYTTFRPNIKIFLSDLLFTFPRVLPEEE